MKRPRPRKVVTTVLVFLLLGAIVNVAVAWIMFAVQAGNAYGLQRYHAMIPHNAKGEAWNILSTYGWGIESHELGTSASYSGDLVTHYRSLPYWCLLAVTYEGYVGGDYAGGWPCRTIHCIFRHSRRLEAMEGTFVIRGTSFLGLRDISGDVGDLTIPTIPIWPGFAINTLFYAAILWLLFAAPFAIRRWRRIKRGLCPACAYPVGASDLCTECGKPVKPRSVEPASP